MKVHQIEDFNVSDYSTQQIKYKEPAATEPDQPQPDSQDKDKTNSDSIYEGKLLIQDRWVFMKNTRSHRQKQVLKTWGLRLVN